MAIFPDSPNSDGIDLERLSIDSLQLAHTGQANGETVIMGLASYT
jgi:hypothetical protein